MATSGALFIFQGFGGRAITVRKFSPSLLVLAASQFSQTGICP
jgi:hypothetical protein